MATWLLPLPKLLTTAATLEHWDLVGSTAGMLDAFCAAVPRLLDASSNLMHQQAMEAAAQALVHTAAPVSAEPAGASFASRASARSELCGLLLRAGTRHSEAGLVSALEEAGVVQTLCGHLWRAATEAVEEAADEEADGAAGAAVIARLGRCKLVLQALFDLRCPAGPLLAAEGFEGLYYDLEEVGARAIMQSVRGAWAAGCRLPFPDSCV